MTDLVLLDDPTDALERAEDPDAIAVAMIPRMTEWLMSVQDDLDGTKNFMDYAETLRVAMEKKRVGEDLQLAATEFVRRAEWRLGELIRAGQQANPPTVQRRCIRRDSCLDEADRAAGAMSDLPSPTDILPSHARTDAYRMADAVPEDVERALAEAKAEKNLSRKNVVTKLPKKKPAAKKVATGKEWHRKRRRIDSQRIVRETIITLDAVWAGLDEVDYSEVQVEPGWIEIVDVAIRSSRRFRDKLKEHRGNDTGGDERQDGNVAEPE